jgi:hypothetical protein
MPFKGEVMICAICEKKKKSSRRAGSNWAYIRLNSTGFYVCPECLCEDTAKETRPIPTHTLNKVDQALAGAHRSL